MKLFTIAFTLATIFAGSVSAADAPPAQKQVDRWCGPGKKSVATRDMGAYKCVPDESSRCPAGLHPVATYNGSNWRCLREVAATPLDTGGVDRWCGLGKRAALTNDLNVYKCVPDPSSRCPEGQHAIATHNGTDWRCVAGAPSQSQDSDAGGVDRWCGPGKKGVATNDMNVYKCVADAGSRCPDGRHAVAMSQGSDWRCLPDGMSGDGLMVVPEKTEKVHVVDENVGSATSGQTGEDGAGHPSQPAEGLDPWCGPGQRSLKGKGLEGENCVPDPASRCGVGLVAKRYDIKWMCTKPVVQGWIDRRCGPGKEAVITRDMSVYKCVPSMKSRCPQGYTAYQDGKIWNCHSLAEAADGSRTCGKGETKILSQDLRVIGCRKEESPDRRRWVPRSIKRN